MDPRDRRIYYAARDFPVLYGRVELLAKVLSRARPNSVHDLLRDRRDPLQFWTFWLAAIIGVLSLTLSTIQGRSGWCLALPRCSSVNGDSRTTVFKPRLLLSCPEGRPTNYSPMAGPRQCLQVPKSFEASQTTSIGRLDDPKLSTGISLSIAPELQIAAQ